MSEPPISRGFRGRKSAAQSARVPPGQHLVSDFPVLSAGPTPQTRLADWSFTLEDGESPLGDIVADAQLAATAAPGQGAAVIAFTNPGGIRTDVIRKADGTVTYADLFASQPFRNQLVTLTLTGAQIKSALEQQWLDPARPRILQVSDGFSYAWDSTKPFGERVIADRLSLNGQPIDLARAYRVTVNNFLSVGGDGFTAFKQGAAAQYGIYDVDALFAYFKANSPISPPPANRIVRVN